MTRLILDEEDFKIERGFILIGLFRDGDLELAPPKDWRPACFNHTPDGCDQVRFATIEECSECPYRKVKE